MTQDEILEIVSKKLSALLLISLSPDAEKKNTAQKVEMLARLGLPNQEIADILATTRGTVEVLKSRAKKKGK
jgi:DNA-binding CsgD family transcriptional regulator